MMFQSYALFPHLPCIDNVAFSLQTELGITFIHVTHSQEEALALADLIVVMQHGYIEQYGTPREVYNQPWTAFVARFIGGHNVFTGRVVSTGPTYTVLHAPDGQRFVVPASDVAVGHAVTFAVRSDKMSLATAALPQPVGVRAVLSMVWPPGAMLCTRRYGAWRIRVRGCN
jgi:putative spermidine/putrescine transport system ATP-binding protein